MSRLQNPIRLFQTVVDQCPYLEDQQSASVLIDPEHQIDQSMFSLLSRSGFRRSGDMLYAPKCPDCSACVSVRIPVEEFKPSRSQKRVWQRNSDLNVQVEPVRFEQHHFDMYLAYQRARHPESTMCSDDPEKYIGFIDSYYSGSFFLCLYQNNTLVGVSVLDQFEAGISAVYTFFDPKLSHRSIGNYAILAAIKHARLNNTPFVYLGYWVKNSQKMDYKERFRPLEGYINRKWHSLPLEK